MLILVSFPFLQPADHILQSAVEYLDKEKNYKGVLQFFKQVCKQGSCIYVILADNYFISHIFLSQIKILLEIQGCSLSARTS